MCRDPRTGSMPPRPRGTSTARQLALQLRARIFDHLVHDLAYRDAAAGLSPADNCDFPAELPDFGFEVDSAHVARGNFFWLRHALSLTDKLATWQFAPRTTYITRDLDLRSPGQGARPRRLQFDQAEREQHHAHVARSGTLAGHALDCVQVGSRCVQVERRHLQPYIADSKHGTIPKYQFGAVFAFSSLLLNRKVFAWVFSSVGNGEKDLEAVHFRFADSLVPPIPPPTTTMMMMNTPSNFSVYQLKRA
jgi:hypothetical protein